MRLCQCVLCVQGEGEEGTDDAHVSTMEVHNSVCVSMCPCVCVCLCLCLCVLCIVCMKEE